jgi:hypothetical protein
MELDKQEITELLLWVRTNNPYMQFRYNKALKCVVLVIAKVADKYIEYHFDDGRFYFNHINATKHNSKPLKDENSLCTCIVDIKSKLRLNKIILPKSILDIETYKPIKK